MNASRDKVPSVIAYKEDGANIWGYAALADPSVLAAKWVKLLLEPNYRYSSVMQPVQNTKTLLTKLSKSPEDVVSDYIRNLWTYILEDIRTFHAEFERAFSLRVVLTCPAIWSEAAKDKTLRAAKAAGLPADQIMLVTEPEAAALAVLKDKTEEESLKV